MQRAARWLGGFLGVSALSAAAAAQANEGVIGDFPVVAYPPENPPTPEKVLLGEALFFEEQLSSDDTMACATCHLPEVGGTDPRAGARHAGLDGFMNTPDDEFGSPGVVLQDAAGDYLHHPLHGIERQATGRNAPSAIGAAFFESLFWDQRAGPVFTDLSGNVVCSENAALESQAVAPFMSDVEMTHQQASWAELTAKLATVRPLDLARDLPPALEAFIGSNQTYGPLFALAFGTPEITRERIAMAIASYERTLVPDQTPFDLGTMTPNQAYGLDVYRDRSKGNCNTCHPSGPGLFSHGVSRNIHLADHDRRVKTPSLRNTGLHRRFMSSGQLTTMDEVIDHYIAQAFMDPITPGDRAALIDFLMNGLTDPRVANRLPPFDRPTLRSEIEPPSVKLFGAATAGSGGFAPAILAQQPSNLGNPSFRIGVGQGLGGAAATLVISLAKAPRGTIIRGVPVYVDLQPHVLARPLALSGSLPGTGTATYHLALPTDAALLGLDAYAQWFVVDPAATGGIAVTQAAHYELFRR